MDIKTYKLESKFSNIDLTAESAVWFGDPCYVVPGWDDQHDIWEELCNKMFIPVTRQHPDTGEAFTSREPFFDDKNNIRVVEIASSIGLGGKFYMWSTAHGDGSYPLTYNHVVQDRLGVDAGCLSLVPMSLIKAWGKETSAKQLGKIVTEFGSRDYISVEEGDMHWGNYDLLTGYESQEDDAELEWEEYESQACQGW